MPRNLCSRTDGLGFCGKNEEYANFTGLWDLSAVMARLIELNYCSHDEFYARLNKERFLIEPWMLKREIIMAPGEATKGSRYYFQDGSQEFCLAPKHIHAKAKELAESDYTPNASERELKEIAKWLRYSYCDFKYANSFYSRFEKPEQKWTRDLSKKWNKQPMLVLYDMKRMLEVLDWLIREDFTLFDEVHVNPYDGDISHTDLEIHRVLKFVDYKKADKSYVEEFYWKNMWDYYRLPEETFDERSFIYKDKYSIR